MNAASHTTPDGTLRSEICIVSPMTSALTIYCSYHRTTYFFKMSSWNNEHTISASFTLQHCHSNGTGDGREWNSNIFSFTFDKFVSIMLICSTIQSGIQDVMSHAWLIFCKACTVNKWTKQYDYSILLNVKVYNLLLSVKLTYCSRMLGHMKVHQYDGWKIIFMWLCKHCTLASYQIVFDA